MAEPFLYEKLDVLKNAGMIATLPEMIEGNLSSNILLREYQLEALKNFVAYFENPNLKKNKQVHTLFHMATGSGKTVIMAGLILYLYTKGYRKFLFFVNQTNVLEKTIDNFTNHLSGKYLFAEEINYLGNRVQIKRVANFSANSGDDIEIVFTTTQKLHMDLFEAKENALTYDDFENNRVVFISDESHHVNTLTKKANKNESEAMNSWEYSVTNALARNKDSIMLEFTATCDLKDKNVLAKYKDKIVFNYPLISFRESGYTKDFKNFATDTDLWTRALMALVMSEYRRFLFANLKLNIKPVIMFKSQKIAESEAFYEEFFKNLEKVTSDEIENLRLIDVEDLTRAIDYFKEKDKSLELLEHSIKNAFVKENAIIMNGSSDNNKENQLLVNSLEDKDNSIRLVFAVDMLNEGWDVLNLFDIVRLYDTRQSKSGGKIGTYTIKEAQLIGRGARYCPFIIEDMEADQKFKRKYDRDITHENRILETMFFHSKNDSRYIAELRQALIATGLQAAEPIVREYKLKESFKDTDFYKKGFVFSNKRVEKSREGIQHIEGSLQAKTYHYKALSQKGRVVSLVGENEVADKLKENVKGIQFKDVRMNILLGAMDCFEELKFNVLKEKYPNLRSKKEFLTSDKYLGNSLLEITYYEEKLTGKDIFLAVKHALSKIATHVISLKPAYEGTKEFSPKPLKKILKDKKIYLNELQGTSGKGYSQISCVEDEYRLDLSSEDWYVFNDNYGTSEEKAFVKYFKCHIEPKLQEKELEYYVIRNERIPELAIYSFDSGERFEPDFLLLVKKKNPDNKDAYQAFVEPKGDHLLQQDAWKNEFLKSIQEHHKIQGSLNVLDDYKILGLPFFNKENTMDEFAKAIEEWIESI